MYFMLWIVFTLWAVKHVFVLINSDLYTKPQDAVWAFMCSICCATSAFYFLGLAIK